MPGNWGHYDTPPQCSLIIDHGKNTTMGSWGQYYPQLLSNVEKALKPLKIQQKFLDTW